MKLLLCLECGDLFNLDYSIKKCSCGKVEGKYIDNINAVYKGGVAVPMGISNPSLLEAIRNQPEKGMGEEFTAFTIPKKCPTFIKQDQ
ncbi:hypothetical protein [Oceanobacillus sp. CF4.6]|uniref:hypothetical protein n=1 Tax=Oceanobacillus sp. CF4.6 TaxID=3373080 RepID=UPI003EE76D03